MTYPSVSPHDPIEEIQPDVRIDTQSLPAPRRTDAAC